MAPKDGNLPADQTKSATLLHYLKIFRKYDISGDGTVSPSELKQALEADGVHLSDSEFHRFLSEVDADGDASIDFQEFCELAKKLFAQHVREKSKLVRIPRAYFHPAQFDQYAAIFREYAGADGILERSELQQFFSKYNITVSPERLQGIMAEVDDDQSGTLGETEFLILLVKALGAKKRNIGPGKCDLKLLKDEGWSMVEIKRAGYELKEFMESGYTVEDLLIPHLFAVADFARAGVPFSDLIATGWDCARSKESGYTLIELVQAGCTILRMRDAGYNDLDAAVSLRANGISAARMKSSGWPLSQLMEAGYSAMDLRLAGYSTGAVGAMRQLVPSVGESMHSKVEPH